VLRTAGEEHPLSDGGFAGIDVGDDPDVANFFEWRGHETMSA
jgi:hypothetical protein